MADLIIEQDKAIVRLGRGNVMIAIIVLGVFLLIGACILGFLVRIWSASDFDPAMLTGLFSSDSDDSIFILVFSIFGLAFTLIPLMVIISMLNGTKKPKEPQSLIFDTTAGMFRVSEQPWDAQKYAVSGLSLPSYSYSQLEGFRLRSYTTSSSSASSSSSTTHYVVCLRKTDGGLWDLHDTLSKTDAENFLTRIQASVDLDKSAGDHVIAPPLPARLSQQKIAGATLYFWTNPSHFGGLLLGLAFISVFIFLMVRMAADFLPFLIFGGIVVGIIALVLLKGIWDGFVSLRYFHCVRILGNDIHVGLVPRRLLASNQDNSQFVADSAAIEAGFKSQKHLDIRQTKRVQYSWRIADRRSTHQELLLLNDAAAAETDELALGNVRWSKLLKTVDAMKKGILTLSLSGLSVGDTMAFERILEQEIAQHGGLAL